MNQDPQQYILALSALNTVVGIRFGELQAAQSAVVRNVDEIERLKRRFEEVYAQREALPQATNEALSSIIEAMGREVREVVRGAGNGSAHHPA